MRAIWSLTISTLIACHCLADGIPNFIRVDDRLCRGGQPTSEGWAYLKSIGVRWAVKLNTECEASDSAAETNGIHVIRLPITLSSQTIGKPSRITLIHAMNAITNHSGNIFIHCSHGQDRTGLIVGCYRVSVQCWSKAKAYAEMKTNGFHPLLRGLYWSWEEDVKPCP